MEQAFQDNPHLATDALVLGRSFKSLKAAGSTKVWGGKAQRSPRMMEEWCPPLWINAGE